MKIAIYHNLGKGGALVQLRNLVESIKNVHEVHIFSLNEELTDIHQATHHLYKATHPSNLFGHIANALFELPTINKHISIDIIKTNFDAVYIFPCKVLQSPDIIRFLKEQNLTYFFAERKREFYEKTSYDHFSIRRTLTRIIRIPIKIKDFINCRSAHRIITNSHFSKSILKNTYGKDSIVVYPGLKQITPTITKTNNTIRAIIVGQLSYTKGYDIAIKLLSASGYKEVTVIGRRTSEFQLINKYSSKYGIKINLFETEDDNKKDALCKKHGVFIACQRNEPFGITTLEACYNDNIVFGLNEGGTPEIIRHGLNGYLFNKDNLANISKILSKIRKQKSLKITKVNTIDWNLMANKIISITK